MKKQGFSLMEMMVVLAIVAVVAAASAPMISKKMMSTNAENGDSPWQWIHRDVDAVFNRNSNAILGRGRVTAFIGATGQNNDAIFPLLYLASSHADQPHITLGSGKTPLFNIFAANGDGIAITNRMIVPSKASVVIGSSPVAINNNAVAIGTCVNETHSRAGEASIAIGNHPSADANNAIAIGTDANKDTGAGANSVAIGHSAKARGTKSISIGMETNNNVASSGTSSICIGDNAGSSGNNAIAIGSSTRATNNQAVAIGTSANSQNENAVAIGTSANSQNLNAVAIGTRSAARVEHAIAIGTSTQASGIEGSLAIVEEANASGGRAIAIGRSAEAAGARSVVIGASSRNEIGDNGIFPAKAYNTDAIVIGSNALARSERQIAIGREVNRYDWDGDARGDNATTTSNDSIAIGTYATSEGQNSIAIGYKASTHDSDNIVIGHGSSGTAFSDSIVIGRDAHVTSSSDKSKAIVIGAEAIARSSSTIAIGNNVEVTGQNSVGIGHNITVGYDNMIQLGDADTTVYIPGNLVVGGSAYLGTSNSDATTHIRLGDQHGKGTYKCLVQLCGKEDQHDDNQYTYIDTESNYGEGDKTEDIFERIYSTSDRRLKNVGEVFQAGLDEIKKLEVFNYTFKDDKNKTPRVGVMAQDLQKIFPNAVTEGDDGYLRIRMEDMFYALVNAIKQLDEKIEDIINNKIVALTKRVTELEKQNAELVKQNEEFEKRLAKLEKKIK